MYEMLTGKDPFHFATSVYELIQIHINTTPPSLAEANPLVTVPADLEAVIFKAMAKKPEDRYQTASELRDALIEVSGGAKGRHSGDLLSLPTPSKSRSQSTGEMIAPAEVVNNSTTPSEHFRRALDPMKGINVDELFNSTADSAAVSNQAQPSASSQPNTTPPPATSSIRRLQSEAKKPLLTPLIIAALVGCCVIAFIINAVPNFIHPAAINSAPNSISPKNQGTPDEVPTQPTKPNAPPAQAGEATILHTPNTAAKKAPEKLPIAHSVPAAKPHAPAAVQRKHSTAIPPVHTAPAHLSHPAGSAKSSNPWDALQGLRRGK